MYFWKCLFSVCADFAGESSDVHPAVCDGPCVPIWYSSIQHEQQPSGTAAAVAESRPIKLPHNPAASGRPDKREDPGEPPPAEEKQGLGAAWSPSPSFGSKLTIPGPGGCGTVGDGGAQRWEQRRGRRAASDAGELWPPEESQEIHFTSGGAEWPLAAAATSSLPHRWLYKWGSGRSGFWKQDTAEASSRTPELPWRVFCLWQP